MLVRVLLVLGILIPLATGDFLPSGCRPAAKEPPRAERFVLERQVHELERLLERASEGPLIRADQGLLVIDQKLIRDLLSAALPYEVVVSGQIRVRILEATVNCEDGLALVHLRGRASFSNQPEEAAFVEANVYGALREFELIRQENVLRTRIDVIGFEMERVKLTDDDHTAVKGLLRDLAQLNISAFQGLDYSFDIPVRLVNDIALPEFVSRGGIRIPGARVPLQASVTDVIALRGKLWIAVRLLDAVQGSDHVAVLPLDRRP